MTPRSSSRRQLAADKMPKSMRSSVPRSSKLMPRQQARLDDAPLTLTVEW
jgi:hypothetical protein